MRAPAAMRNAAVVSNSVTGSPSKTRRSFRRPIARRRNPSDCEKVLKTKTTLHGNTFCHGFLRVSNTSTLGTCLRSIEMSSLVFSNRFQERSRYVRVVIPCNRCYKLHGLHWLTFKPSKVVILLKLASIYCRFYNQGFISYQIPISLPCVLNHPV